MKLVSISANPRVNLRSGGGHFLKSARTAFRINSRLLRDEQAGPRLDVIGPANDLSRQARDPDIRTAKVVSRAPTTDAASIGPYDTRLVPVAVVIDVNRCRNFNREPSYLWWSE